jgi:hypothetical protein
MRNRNWVLAGVLVLAVIAAGVLAGHGKHAPGAGAQPQVSFGSQVQQLGATSDLVYTNGWVASGGTQAIAVYAGRQRFKRANGLFVVIRRTGGTEKITRVVVRASGALTLLRPARPASERAAFAETLHFVTANGGTGTLDLSGDRASLSG